MFTVKVFISLVVFCQASYFLLGVGLFFNKKLGAIERWCGSPLYSFEWFIFKKDLKDTQQYFLLLWRFAIEKYFGPFIMAWRSGGIFIDGPNLLSCLIDCDDDWERPSKGAYRSPVKRFIWYQWKCVPLLDPFVVYIYRKRNEMENEREAGFHSFHSLTVILNRN